MDLAHTGIAEDRDSAGQKKSCAENDQSYSNPFHGSDPAFLAE
jgi:hypothetical protein